MKMFLGMRVVLIKKALCCLLGLVLLGAAEAAESSQVALDIALTPVGSFVAKTQAVTGHVSPKGDLLIATKIEVDLAKLDSGIELRDKHMIDEYFETKKFPKAVLKSAKGKGGKFIGLLNIRGIDQKIDGTYESVGKTIVAKFKTTLSAFKIKKANYMGVGVADEVSVTVTLPVK